MLIHCWWCVKVKLKFLWSTDLLWWKISREVNRCLWKILSWITFSGASVDIQELTSFLQLADFGIQAYSRRILYAGEMFMLCFPHMWQGGGAVHQGGGAPMESTRSHMASSICCMRRRVASAPCVVLLQCRAISAVFKLANTSLSDGTLR